jgi:hypothetical protein
MMNKIDLEIADFPNLQTVQFDWAEKLPEIDTPHSSTGNKEFNLQDHSPKYIYA